MTPEPFTTASAKVFAIPALLENILLHLAHKNHIDAGPDLGMKRLFAVQPVGKTFRAVTTGSPKLQHAMYRPHYAKKDCDPKYNKTDRFNPLLCSKDVVGPILSSVWFEFYGDCGLVKICVRKGCEIRRRDVPAQRALVAERPSWCGTNIMAGSEQVRYGLGGYAGPITVTGDGERLETLGQLAVWLAEQCESY